jgi:hypothetical protein
MQMTLPIYLTAFTTSAVRLSVFPVTQNIFLNVFIKINTCNSNTAFSAIPWHHTSTAQQALSRTNYRVRGIIITAKMKRILWHSEFVLKYLLFLPNTLVGGCNDAYCSCNNVY